MKTINMLMNDDIKKILTFVKNKKESTDIIFSNEKFHEIILRVRFYENTNANNSTFVTIDISLIKSYESKLDSYFESALLLEWGGNVKDFNKKIIDRFSTIFENAEQTILSITGK